MAIETTHRINLETFEKLEHCLLRDWEIEDIKKEIEYYISVINEGLEEGRDRYLDGFISTYENQLIGIRRICSMIGLNVRTPINEVS